MADYPSSSRRSCDNQLDNSSSPVLNRRQLSKSTSELSCRGIDGDSNNSSPHHSNSRSGSPAVGVLQRTHGFLSTLKHRFSRSRSRDRTKKTTGLDGDADRESFDYAADYSSEQSSSGTPFTQSPMHRPTIASSPLARRSESPKSSKGKYLDNKDSKYGFYDQDESQLRRENHLRKHAFFQLRVHLVSGHDLMAMDKNGTSDPYVKFKMGGRLLHKSKTLHRDLNPIWNETFTVPIEDPFQPINIKVFDYDWGLQDDFMGSAKLDLTKLELGIQTDLVFRLEDPSRPDSDLGEIHLMATLWPRTQEDKEQYYLRNPKLADASRRLKSQIWSSVVTIILVEAKNLPNDPDSYTQEPYVKFRLGNEKYKSKTSYCARWLEQFDLHLFDDDQMLEMTLWNRSNQYGRCIIDLRSLPRETTQGLWQQFEDCSAKIYLMLTISGTTASETITDLASYKEDWREKEMIQSRYAWHKTLNNLRDVGHLTVKVFGATGLAAADLGGKSDPFCVLELVNARLQTQTEYKTLTPNWNKIFTFNVKDITSTLEVTVFDEDKDHKVEFLGRVEIPLLRIRNGERRWYALKEKKMCARAKGNSPQILLEMHIYWNQIRAAIRALEPREEKLVQQEVKFKRQLFLHNVTRLKSVVMYFIEWGRYVQSCFEWESPIRSIIAFILWIVACIWFDISTIPAIIVILLLKNWFVMWITGSTASAYVDDCEMNVDDEDDDDKEREEKRTLKERLQAIQEVSQTVQNTIGYLASLGESIKNTFNFSVPELTWLALLLLIIACFVLHFIPMRVLLLLWGIVKFTRRLIRPHSVPNNEVLDLLSRVPDDNQLISHRELPPNLPGEGTPRRDTKKKSKAS